MPCVVQHDFQAEEVAGRIMMDERHSRAMTVQQQILPPSQDE